MAGDLGGLAEYVFIVLTAAASWIWKLRKCHISLSWPMTEATYFSGEVVMPREGEGVSTHIVEMRFTYCVDSETFSGEYRQGLSSHDKGKQLLLSFQNRPLYVRYNPAKPMDNFMDPYRDIRR